MQTKLVIWVLRFPTFNNRKKTLPAKCLIKRYKKAKLSFFGKKKIGYIWAKSRDRSHKDTAQVDSQKATYNEAAWLSPV